MLKICLLVDNSTDGDDHRRELNKYTHTRQNKVKEVEHESYVEKNTAKQNDILPRFVNPI